MKLLLVVTALAVQAELAHAQYPHGRRRSPGPAPSPRGPPPNKTVTAYHMFEPKYTGLANRDGGDFKGDVSFIFMTFNPREAGNPEADITDNIFEMSTVTVEDWSTAYLRCNAPGANQSSRDFCPSTNTDYCCSNRTENTKATLPGWENNEKLTGGGYWFSFPRESQGTQWTEKIVRRIKSRCLADAWRSDAGGCAECGSALDQCVATCIQNTLAPKSSQYPYERDLTKLQVTWDRVFSDKTLCPDEPFPGAVHTVIV